MSKSQFHQKTIQVRTVSGPIEVPALVRSGLAYHKRVGGSGWTVTHVASGMKLDPYTHAGLNSVEEATEYIAYALSLKVPWSSDLEWEDWWQGDPPPALRNLQAGWVNWWHEYFQGRVAERDAPNILDIFGA
jgi:hypothetical protein